MNAPDIFNRCDETNAILGFLAAPSDRLLLVSGESGCGKSSVVERALRTESERFGAANYTVLTYRFEDPELANESERFGQFLLDSYAQLRPAWFMDSWMRNRGAHAESWGLRLPFATFNFRGPNLRDVHKADFFFEKFAETLGRHYRVVRLENVENFGTQSNLVVIEKLACQPIGPKLIVEIGTLSADAELALRFVRQRCRPKHLEIKLFDADETAACFRFVHQGRTPAASLFDDSRGNALAIRHYGTALAELPIADKVRQRFDGFPPETMILLWCLAALRGTAELDFLHAASTLGAAFEPTLIRLRQADVVRLEENHRVSFSHSLFGRYFASNSFSNDVAFFGRRRIVTHLLSQPTRSLVEMRELAKQLFALREFDAAWRWAMEAAETSYWQQDFRAVDELAEILDGCHGIPPRSQRNANVLLVQTAIRTGNAAAFVARMATLDETHDGVAILLRAQGFYLLNRFLEAIEQCGRLAHLAEDGFLAARALGVRAASLIALGRHEEASDDFAEAQRSAIATADHELRLELLRLSPELEVAAVWKLRFEELRQSSLPDRFPYLYAKCLHNFGSFLALDSGGQEGTDELAAAAAVFEAGHYPEYSYAVIMAAAVMLLQGRIEHARRMLEENLPWCHEQYDTFGFKNNLGVAAALTADWLKAEFWFQEAQQALRHEVFPLDDPYFHFQVNHNRAITWAALGRHADAVRSLESLQVPRDTADYDLKLFRREHLLTLFRAQQPPPLILEYPAKPRRWTTQTCLMELATLQFYDFNVNVLRPGLC